MKTCLIVIVCISLTGCVSRTVWHHGEIRGRVIAASTGEPVPDASVSLAGLSEIYRTDSEGRYVIPEHQEKRWVSVFPSDIVTRTVIEVKSAESGDGRVEIRGRGTSSKPFPQDAPDILIQK